MLVKDGDIAPQSTGVAGKIGVQSLAERTVDTGQERVVRGADECGVKREIRVGDPGGLLAAQCDAQLRQRYPEPMQILLGTLSRCPCPGRQLEISSQAMQLGAVCAPNRQGEVSVPLAVADEGADTVLGPQQAGEGQGHDRCVHGREADFERRRQGFDRW